MRSVFQSRLSLLAATAVQFLFISTLLRLVFYIWSFQDLPLSLIHFFRIFFTGLFYDFGSISLVTTVYIVYLIVFPKRFYGSLLDRISSYSGYILVTIICTFSFFAEVTFWDEFQTRFNFIAVDYLVYTNEVIENINESYPIPLLLIIILSLVTTQFLVLRKLKIFQYTFQPTRNYKVSYLGLGILIVPLFYTALITNRGAEWSNNRYENELSKAGIYSFSAAFRTNELSYTEFYDTQDITETFKVLKAHLARRNEPFVKPDSLFNLGRRIEREGEELQPNVIFICIESLSAEFLSHFGNDRNITPTLDSLLNHSIYFENIYATGTRTVRGMEAITLSIPPSPGRSIVKRLDNHHLHNIGEVFKEKGYKRTFFYGGDGYFDNMNEFFGGNGFDIVDRGRGYLFGDSFSANRENIEDNEVTFENAWGVCDEDIYRRVLKEADKSYKSGKPFFDFVMTTSNHRPYTYPEGKIDIPSGSGRDGAIKYTDYAINQFLKEAKSKEWFSNTVFVIMADHCASSAGKWELNIDKYRIPAIVYNLPNHEPKAIDLQCSQIDLFPTLFGYLNWSYTSYFYGKDVNTFTDSDQRAFIGNYRKLGLLKGDTLEVLSEQKHHNLYLWNKKDNSLVHLGNKAAFLKETVSYYQSIDFLYQNRLLRSADLLN